MYFSLLKNVRIIIDNLQMRWNCCIEKHISTYPSTKNFKLIIAQENIARLWIRSNLNDRPYSTVNEHSKKMCLIVSSWQVIRMTPCKDTSWRFLLIEVPCFSYLVIGVNRQIWVYYYTLHEVHHFFSNLVVRVNWHIWVYYHSHQNSTFRCDTWTTTNAVGQLQRADPFGPFGSVFVCLGRNQGPTCRRKRTNLRFLSMPTEFRPKFEPGLHLRGRIWTPRGVLPVRPPGPAVSRTEQPTTVCNATGDVFIWPPACQTLGSQNPSASLMSTTRFYSCRQCWT